MCPPPRRLYRHDYYHTLFERSYCVLNLASIFDNLPTQQPKITEAVTSLASMNQNLRIEQTHFCQPVVTYKRNVQNTDNFLQICHLRPTPTDQKLSISRLSSVTPDKGLCLPAVQRYYAAKALHIEPYLAIQLFSCSAASILQ